MELIVQVKQTHWLLHWLNVKYHSRQTICLITRQCFHPVSHHSYQHDRHCWANSVLQCPPVLWASIQAFFQDIRLATKAWLFKHNPAENKNKRGAPFTFDMTFFFHFHFILIGKETECLMGCGWNPQEFRHSYARSATTCGQNPIPSHMIASQQLLCWKMWHVTSGCGSGCCICRTVCVLTCKTEKLTVVSQQNKRNANEPIKQQKNMGEAAQSNNRLAAQQE